MSGSIQSSNMELDSSEENVSQENEVRKEQFVHQKNDTRQP